MAQWYNKIMHFYDDKEANEKLRKVVGKNDITERIEEDPEMPEKGEVFEAVDILVHGARELYYDKDMDWDEMITQLAESILKLKGKEKKLKAMD